MNDLKQLKKQLIRLREQWDNTASYLDRTAGTLPIDSGWGKTVDSPAEFNRAQARALQYCSGELYHIIDCIQDDDMPTENPLIG